MTSVQPDRFFDGTSSKEGLARPTYHTKSPDHRASSDRSKMLVPWAVHDTICNLCGRTLLRKPPLAAIAHASLLHLKTVTAPSLHVLHQTNGIMPGGITRQKAHVAHHHKEGLSATQGDVCALVVAKETKKKTSVVRNFWLLREQGAASSESDYPILETLLPTNPSASVGCCE